MPPATQNSAVLREAEELLREFISNEQLIMNQTLGRSQLSQINGGVQNIDQECGYPATEQLTVEGYYKPFYDRHPIANRVVEVMPRECWSTPPDIYETEDKEEITAFEKAWEELALTLLGESKFKQKEEGNPIWEYLQRVDILSGIGFYGVLLLGLDDGLDLDQPATHRESQKLLYLRAFDESCLEISNYIVDETDVRYGLPEFYNIEFSTPEGVAGVGVQSKTVKVHWSRVLHVAEGIGSNEVFGTPRQRPVFNRLWDLRKLYGGSAEMYWKGAFPGVSIETHPHLGGANTVDVSGLKQMITNYQEGLQRYLTLRGMAAKSLAPQVVDPNEQIGVQIEAICIQKGIPKRVFMGSEVGELASTQDSEAWDKRIETRQKTYLTPRVIVPLIDRLISLGVLPTPEQYGVSWPDRSKPTEDEKAATAIKIVHALTKYVAGDVEMIMSPVDFLVRVMGYDQDEAQQILETAIAAFDESEERDLSRDIMEAKALKKHKLPAVPDDIKQAMLEADAETSVKADAVGEKHTGKASGSKNVRKLTAIQRAKTNPADKELGEDDKLE